MRKKLLITLLISQLCACSVTFVYVDKKAYVNGKSNSVTLIGSDLKDNTATQTSDGTLKIPLVK
jgi:hypothetical protein